MKKIYLTPVLHIISVEPHAHILDASNVRTVNTGSTGITYGGGSNQAARVKDNGGYNVWDDDWNE